MSAAFAIRLTDSYNKLRECYVSADPTEWRTQTLGEAKTWKTKSGATRWLQGRPETRGEVVVVELGPRSGLPVAVKE
jgi:hypothetical protein